MSYLHKTIYITIYYLKFVEVAQIQLGIIYIFFVKKNTKALDKISKI